MASYIRLRDTKLARTLPVGEHIAAQNLQWQNRCRSTFRCASPRVDSPRPTTATTVEYPPSPKVDRKSLPPGPPELPVVEQAVRYLTNPWA